MTELLKNNEGIFHIYRPVKIGSEMSWCLSDDLGRKIGCPPSSDPGREISPNLGRSFTGQRAQNWAGCFPGYSRDQGRVESLVPVIRWPDAESTLTVTT